MLHDIRYLGAFLIPICTFAGITLRGPWTFTGVAFAFVVIPLVELILGQSQTQATKGFVGRRLPDKWFDILLYCNIPIVYTAVWMLGDLTSTASLSTIETIGLILSTGVLLGANGINVGHELGHRGNPVQRMLGKMLLLPSLYMHFHIEHNRGHHLHVATRNDPSTARYGEALYAFWPRTLIMTYINAWRIESARIRGRSATGIKGINGMLTYTVIELGYCVSLFVLFGLSSTLILLASGCVGALLLETINYIEHYGLSRRRLETGKFERVTDRHSWNSNHHIGRIVLYELTRHSDHHAIAGKPYQRLEHRDAAPQLPYGYPTSMLLAMCPPLWFRIMNERVPAEMREEA
jgi:alkane 1-monooxygenase